VSVGDLTALFAECIEVTSNLLIPGHLGRVISQTVEKVGGLFIRRWLLFVGHLGWLDRWLILIRVGGLLLLCRTTMILSLLLELTGLGEIKFGIWYRFWTTLLD
jgi:hypothetical protein